MRYLLVFLFVGLGEILTAQEPLKPLSYLTGVYVFCGPDLPKQFTYVVERRTGNDTTWTTVAELHAPKTESECMGRFMNIPAVMLVNTQVDTARIQWVWNKIATGNSVDSMYAYANDPRYQFVAGTGWFDEGLKEGNYSYRISKKNRQDQLTVVSEQRINFPSDAYRGQLSTVRFKPDDRGVTIHYALSDTLHTAGVKLFRSKQRENNYAEVKATAFFTRINDEWIAEIIDSSVTKGITYQYVAVPYDILGNMGIYSDTLAIYAMARAADIGMVNTFDVKPVPEKKGMQLNWEIRSAIAITSVEVYRSRAGYDGMYDKIASLAPGQNSFFDEQDILPATSYFYYIIANASYGRSFPSARVPGILKGSNANIIPPQNLSVNRNGNIVTLTFTKVEDDTRGYYIYRGNSYTGPMKQLQRMLLSTDSIVSYSDTLPELNTPEVYSYAVADINTSYAVGPQSERVSVRTSGRIPVPDGVTALKKGDHVWITWKDQLVKNIAVTKYKLVRSEVTENDSVLSAPLIVTLPVHQNSYIDSSVTEGHRYRYSVRCEGIEETDQGAFSQWASISFSEVLPLAPAHITATAGDRVSLRWESPEDASVIKINIYRAKANETPQKIASLPITAKTFSDDKIEKGVTYYYLLSSENKKQKESELTDPVAVKVRE